MALVIEDLNGAIKTSVVKTVKKIVSVAQKAKSVSSSSSSSASSSTKNPIVSEGGKIPVTIEGVSSGIRLEFDALISQDQSLEATVPEYPVEEGYSISDSIMLGAEKLDLVVFLTDTPVTWRKRHSGSGRVVDVEKRLKELYYRRELVNVYTSDTVYYDMAIESIAISKNNDTGKAREIPISLKKVHVTSAKVVTIPDSYGKGGASGELAGNANTSSDSVAEENQKSSSILLNIMNSINEKK